MQIKICTANPEGAGAGGKEPAHSWFTLSILVGLWAFSG